MQPLLSHRILRAQDHVTSWRRRTDSFYGPRSMVEQNRNEIGFSSNPSGGRGTPGKAAWVPDPGQQTSVRKAFEEITWLQAIPGGTLDALADQAVLHRVPAGSLLFEQAEIPVFAQFLLSGRIELLGVR